jgi:quercetin dioxygenase-like cupin family protein
MRVIEAARRPGRPIEQFDSSGVEHLGGLRLGGPRALTFLHFQAGAHLGRHPTVMRQVFCVVDGQGWASGGEEQVVQLTAGQGAVWEPGEEHESGTDTGMSVVVLEGGEIEVL